MQKPIETQCVGDFEGPWVEPDWESGLIERCRRYWNTPVGELPDIAVITYLNQRIAPGLIIEVARKRVEAGRYDDTEMYEGQLAEALQVACLK